MENTMEVFQNTNYCAYVCMCILSRVQLFAAPWTARLLCPWDFLASVLEWVAISSSRGYFWPSRSNLCLLHCMWTLPLSHLGPSNYHTIQQFYFDIYLKKMKTVIWKDPDAGKDWRQEEKGTTEDEMVGWHHWLNRHEFEQAPGDGEGQGSLACCSPWGQKESDTT